MVKQVKKDSPILVNLPGIESAELKVLEKVVDGNRPLSLSWTMLAVAAVLLSQIAYDTNPKIKHFEFMNSETVNLLVKKVLANSAWSRTIYALMAIRKTLGVYDLQNDPEAEKETLRSDFDDLVDNPKGPAATKGGIRSALTSPDRTRKYRRGLMLQASGSMCNKPLSSPSSVISREHAGRITLGEIANLTPFGRVIGIEEIRMEFNNLMPYDENGRLELVDNFKLITPSNLTTIEIELGLKISRSSLEVSPKELAVDKDNLDDFQKLIWNAKKSLS